MPLEKGSVEKMEMSQMSALPFTLRAGVAFLPGGRCNPWDLTIGHVGQAGKKSRK